MYVYSHIHVCAVVGFQVSDCTTFPVQVSALVAAYCTFGGSLLTIPLHAYVHAVAYCCDLQLVYVSLESLERACEFKVSACNHVDIHVQLRLFSILYQAIYFFISLCALLCIHLSMHI